MLFRSIQTKRAVKYLAISMAVPVSVFIAGVGVEPRYLWPTTSTVAILALGIGADFFIEKVGKRSRRQEARLLSKSDAQ